MYVADILVLLEASGTGCHIGGKYIGALIYADDLILISVSLRNMQRMMGTYRYSEDRYSERSQGYRGSLSGVWLSH